ncbi:MAG: SRPBCC domain-containing protein [Gemmatimonadaceae bacterium]|nr:SRPBCC domain-containing protein [Gemmatimonadaceae bacterium]
MINSRALILAVLLGTVLQVAMVVVGHSNKSVANLFAVGGMGFSFLAGLAYAMWARGASPSALAIGGLVAGAVCAFLGILVSYLLGDVPPSLLALGTISSAVTGALGGWLGKFLFRAGGAVAIVAVIAGAPLHAHAQAASGRTTTQDVSPIVAEAIVEAPVDAVWAAWVTSAGLRAWLAPHADVDLRIGGILRTNYNAEGTIGDPQTIENTILSLDPGRMLSIQVSKAPAGLPFPTAIGQMWTVMYFDPVGADRTRVRVVGLGFHPDAESQQMRAFFERGNETTLQQLQRHFAAKARQ